MTGGGVWMESLLSLLSPPLSPPQAVSPRHMARASMNAVKILPYFITISPCLQIPAAPWWRKTRHIFLAASYRPQMMRKLCIISIVHREVSPFHSPVVSICRPCRQSAACRTAALSPLRSGGGACPECAAAPAPPAFRAAFAAYTIRNDKKCGLARKKYTNILQILENYFLFPPPVLY